MHYAIIYNSDEEWNIGEVPVHRGDLLGYTDFPDDDCFKDKPFDFIPVENADMNPLEWKYEDGKWKRY